MDENVENLENLDCNFKLMKNKYSFAYNIDLFNF